MKVVMIGAGYVGLTTGACLAELGHSVTCVDTDAARIKTLGLGATPIYEPGLEALIRKNRRLGRLDFSPDTKGPAGKADAIFLAVGTPAAPGGDIDLSHIETAARQIAPAMKPNAVVVVKSTVVVGTCRRLREVIAEKRLGLDFSVASNPEFLREGTAIQDFLHPDRIVIGADDRRAATVLEELYAPLAKRRTPILITNTANAELIKYASNAFLALKIGFINDVADLCEQVGGDVEAVARGMGLDSRIGMSFLSPGPGFGGSCFPKDTRAFVATGRKHRARQSLVETLVAKNESRKNSLARRVLAELGERARGARIAVFGLAFKANTDDVRDSAALTIIPLLQQAGLAVRAHDPQAEANAARHLSGVEMHDCMYAAAKGVDAVLVLTEWDDYRTIDLKRLSKTMSGSLVIDYRNMFTPRQMALSGLRYVSLGRSASPKTAGAVVSKASKALQLATAAPNHL
ncbi:UDP-glucose dehydrogenase family protein [Mesorhizobium sp. AaZ16]|uniref:UDP-glucose dehydrogenase family protein n=1 Tax=Mesorhizobium sp. AaZ16 TaxID=3402289 RepID=UPI00374EB640